VYGSDVAIKVPKRQDIDDDDLAALVEEVEIWRYAPHALHCSFLSLGALF
jgi:hypothetical protein